MGTEPEKKVYAYLMQTGIPFYYQTMVDVSIPGIDLIKWARPDFVIPSYKIVIEVQGAYWHSTAEQMDEDATKHALYEMAGYKVLTWWDYELAYQHPAELAMREAPEIGYYTGPRVGEVITEHKEYIDDSAGIRTLNTERKDWFNSRATIKTRKKSTTRSKGVLSYEPRG